MEGESGDTNKPKFGWGGTTSTLKKHPSNKHKKNEFAVPPHATFFPQRKSFFNQISGIVKKKHLKGTPHSS